MRKPTHGLAAGHFRAVPAGKLVRLYGTASKGDYNGAFRYSWNWVQLPEDSQLDAAALKLANTRNPHFTPDVEGNYELHSPCKSATARRPPPPATFCCK